MEGGYIGRFGPEKIVLFLTVPKTDGEWEGALFKNNTQYATLNLTSKEGYIKGYIKEVDSQKKYHFKALYIDEQIGFSFLDTIANPFYSGIPYHIFTKVSNAAKPNPDKILQADIGHDSDLFGEWYSVDDRPKEYTKMRKSGDLKVYGEANKDQIDYTKYRLQWLTKDKAIYYKASPILKPQNFSEVKLGEYSVENDHLRVYVHTGMVLNYKRKNPFINGKE